MKKIKVLVLLSGGLDSILAAKILGNQRIKVTALSFKSYFFNEGQARKATKNLKIPLRVVDFSKEHLEMVKSPKYGYGKAMNPCIDCHILMLKEAKKIMVAEKFNFVATGEVLGERPMSQRREILELVAKDSSLKEYLLRPLSAKLLKKTIPEKLGWIDREKLFGISGRSRKKQLSLAKEMKISWYPAPAGGCLLTNLGFAKRLKELLKIAPKYNGNDIQLLKNGRHFQENKIKIVVGRNKDENSKIEKIARRKDVLIEMKNYPGPLTLVRDYSNTRAAAKGEEENLSSSTRKIPQKTIKKAMEMTQFYSTRARNQKNVEFFTKIV